MNCILDGEYCIAEWDEGDYEGVIVSAGGPAHSQPQAEGRILIGYYRFKHHPILILSA
jgi:hypothetical protein